MKIKTILLSICLSILILISIVSGRYNIGIGNLINIILNSEITTSDHIIFYQIRLPRILLVVLSGGALSLAGLVYQSIFRNPLVSPDVLGVSSGCSLGAVIAIVLIGKSSFYIQLLSFVAGVICVVISMTLSKIIGSNKLLSLIISGIVTSSIATSVIMILKYVADPYKHLPTIEFWLMGGFYNSSWKNINNILFILLVSTGILFLMRWKLKVITLGEEEAVTLGINVKLVTVVSILAATFLVAAVVSVAGIVSWIGLISPHIVRLYVGEDISKTIPVSMISGSIILLSADTIARTIFPAEIPISILTSLVGAPFLIYFLWERGRRENVFKS